MSDSSRYQKYVFRSSGPGRVDDLLKDLRDLCKQGLAIEHYETRGYPYFYFEDVKTGYLWQVKDTGEADSGMQRVDHYYYSDPYCGPGPIWDFLPSTYLAKRPDLVARSQCAKTHKQRLHEG